MNTIPMNTTRTDRRGFLEQTIGGLSVATLAAGNLAAGSSAIVASEGGSTIRPQVPHFQPKAKSVIWLFMRGGVSHMESFDPKPLLNKLQGKTIDETEFANVQDPERLKKVRVVVVNDANGQQRNELYPLQVGFSKRGL